MKWKGTVSQSGMTSIATRFAIANATQAPSTHVKRCVGHCRSGAIDAVPLPPDRLDDVDPELRPQPSDVDVDHVRAGIEVVPPDVRQEPFLRDRLAGLLNQFLQEQELPL